MLTPCFLLILLLLSPPSIAHNLSSRNPPSISRQVASKVCPCVCTSAKGNEGNLCVGTSRALCVTSKCALPFTKGKTCCYKGKKLSPTGTYIQNRKTLLGFLRRYFKIHLGNCIKFNSAPISDRVLTLRLIAKTRCDPKKSDFQDAFDALRTMPEAIAIFVDPPFIDFNPTILTVVKLQFIYRERVGVRLDTCQSKAFNGQAAAAIYNLFFIANRLNCVRASFQLKRTFAALVNINLSEGCIVERHIFDRAYDHLKTDPTFDQVFVDRHRLRYAAVGLSTITLTFKSIVCDPSPSATATPTTSSTPTRTPSRTPTPSPSRTPTPSPTPTRTRTPTPSPTPTRTRTPTPTPTRTRTPTPSKRRILTPPICFTRFPGGCDCRRFDTTIDCERECQCIFQLERKQKRLKRLQRRRKLSGPNRRWRKYRG